MAGRRRSHKEVVLNGQTVGKAGYPMPSLFRFLVVAATLTAVAFGGLFVLATYFEPEPREVSKTLPGVKVKR